jgi:hypothetical protein
MIEGFAAADYFNIRCAKCKRETLNEYLGFDPSMPVLRATCSTCKTTHDYKLHTGNWRGLPEGRAHLLGRPVDGYRARSAPAPP